MRTLAELIEALTNLVETGECDGSEMLMMAHQPNYPLQCSIGGVSVKADEDAVMPDEGSPSPPMIVYICEGSWRPRRADGSEMSPYAPRSAWDYE